MVKKQYMSPANQSITITSNVGQFGWCIRCDWGCRTVAITGWHRNRIDRTDAESPEPVTLEWQMTLDGE